MNRHQLLRRAKRLKRQLWALYLALKDPGTPILARVVILCAVAYAASPIDLIPDFIPLIGQLDDLLLVPLLITLALRLIPKDVAARCRREAWKHLVAGERVKTPAAAAAAAIFVCLWLGFAAWVLHLLF
ncbi:MAG: hypothetical protein A2Z99_00165 [Treponema sp. GWB1_62_6]|nr:MAG: hypothetical protein A2Y36_06385 [Treponema sp. GWA1_62_8]OHE63314.1 MAG: hypothetical protein A2001_11365 [Treponema sp. GWC1_61_84]OHE64483.1 MAG: hypothetical protein A2Z99_00165 [Treponema sp. GWB1_62_6]OHE69184.1 MAG: hypothetical protein A2413_09125 [Treponema sp. RIFOXYC1_FULL_61_9]HCM26310.1 hypothetical protein [Treponema sp.]